MSIAWVWHASVWNIYMVEVHESTKRLKHDRFTVGDYQMGIHAHVIRCSKRIAMGSEVLCFSCNRTAGCPAGGAVINAAGCTGACLHWAVQLIENPPFWDEEPFNWQTWTFEDAQWNSFSIACSNLNGLGCGYLCVDLVEGHISQERMLAEEWIHIVFNRYRYFLEHASVHAIADACPLLPQFCVLLEKLSEQVLGMDTVVYTMSVDFALDGLCVRTTNMAGVEVHSGKMSWWQPVTPSRHYPEPVYRMARDGNLYTCPEYSAHYGVEKAASRWLASPACYDHDIRIVDEMGRVVEPVPQSS